MDNGILSGFLTSRAEAAWKYALTTQNAEASRKWVMAAAAYRTALDEYLTNGDSDAVKQFTAVGMDASDDALATERAAEGA